jgi:hypothetical protein
MCVGDPRSWQARWVRLWVGIGFAGDCPNSRRGLRDRFRRSAGKSLAHAFPQDGPNWLVRTAGLEPARPEGRKIVTGKEYR